MLPDAGSTDFLVLSAVWAMPDDLAPGAPGFWPGRLYREFSGAFLEQGMLATALLSPDGTCSLESPAGLNSGVRTAWRCTETSSFDATLAYAVPPEPAAREDAAVLRRGIPLWRILAPQGNPLGIAQRKLNMASPTTLSFERMAHTRPVSTLASRMAILRASSCETFMVRS